MQATGNTIVRKSYNNVILITHWEVIAQNAIPSTNEKLAKS